MLLRDATPTDLPAISDIYNALVPTTTVAWTEAPETLADRVAWYERHRADGFPVLVAESDGEVVGFAAYGSFRGAGRWPGYRFTVEHTIHVREAHWGGGIGRLLLGLLVERAVDAGLHVMVGAIDSANEASIRFHERMGFVEVARMPEVGIKFGAWLDLVLMQRILPSR